MEIIAEQMPWSCVPVQRIWLICISIDLHYINLVFRIVHGIVHAISLQQFSLNSHFMFMGSTDNCLFFNLSTPHSLQVQQWISTVQA